MGEPKVGLHTETVRDKLKKHIGPKKNPRLRESMINQARIADGEKAANELYKEFSYDNKNMKISDWNASSKSRPGGFQIGICLKECINKGTELCNSCFKFSNLVENTEVPHGVH